MGDTIDRLNAALADRYRIERELGAGGMATVYLAADLKHDRKVAIKVLKPELAAVVGAERFLTEIKTTANLLHPHILPLHDSGEAGGFLFYVMPYVEGETLRARLEREKQLPIDDAVRIATDVAEALHTAHEQGVIHRDIKPANILLSKGRPLVADFGIAFAVSAAGGGRLTETGLSMGTPFYMSPEQASADREPTAASDVYSLGCVLYEMLVGDPPYMGGNAQAVLVKVLTDEAPPATRARPSIPPNVDAAVRRALEKLPADRFRSAQAFARALGDPGFRHAPPSAGVSAQPQPARVWNRVSIGAMGLAAVLAMAAAWGWLRPVPEPSPAVATRAVVEGNATGTGKRLAISPDGRWLALRGTDTLSGALYVRSAADPEWRLLPNTEGATYPSFSPAGDWIAFGSESEIRKVPVEGGPVLTLATGSYPHWGMNDSIVFSTSAGAIQLVGPDGGEPRTLFQSDTLNALRPHLLPNGRGVLFQTPTGGDPMLAEVMVLDLESGRVTRVAPSGNQPAWVSTGHVVYAHGNGALMGVPFDLETLETTGGHEVLLDRLMVSSGGNAQYDISTTGTLYYDAAEAVEARNQLVEVAMDGAAEALSRPAGSIWIPRYSPDGKRIVYEEQGAGLVNARILDLATGADRPFTTTGGSIPIWSSDGVELYFTSHEGDQRGGFTRPADSREAATRLFTLEGGPFWFMDVSSDGALAIIGQGLGPGSDLLLARRSGDTMTVEPLLDSEAGESHANISPDDRWFVYTSDETGENRVYVNTFPDLTGQRPVSPAHGVDPVWSRDGRRIYYRSGTRFYAVDVAADGGTFSPSAPRLLFDRREFVSRGGEYFRNWDLHPDGDRFVMMAAAGGGDLFASEMYIVTNWFAELLERMRSGAR